MALVKMNRVDFHRIYDLLNGVAMGQAPDPQELEEVRSFAKMMLDNTFQDQQLEDQQEKAKQAKSRVIPPDKITAEEKGLIQKMFTNP